MDVGGNSTSAVNATIGEGDVCSGQEETGACISWFQVQNMIKSFIQRQTALENLNDLLAG